MVPDSELMLDTISAHELTHGLQDQHFDLQQVPAGETRTASRARRRRSRRARRFVAEGDATFTMFLYAAVVDGEAVKLEPTMLKMLRAQLEQFAAMSPEEMIKQNAAGFSSMDPEIKKSIDAMDDIPLTVLVPMVDSYMQGALLVAAAFDQGGWKAVDALYTDPPESTEQVLHPLDEALSAPRSSAARDAARRPPEHRARRRSCSASCSGRSTSACGRRTARTSRPRAGAVIARA